MTNTVEEFTDFVVKFRNPITKLLHSSWAVKAENAVKAVEAAIERAGNEMRGTEIPLLRTYDTAISDAKGLPVKSVDKLLTKAQLQSQVSAIQAQLKMLDDDVPASDSVPVGATASSAPQMVMGEARPNQGTFTQEQVDEMIAAAKAKTAAAQSGGTA